MMPHSYPIQDLDNQLSEYKQIAMPIIQYANKPESNQPWSESIDPLSKKQAFHTNSLQLTGGYSIYEKEACHSIYGLHRWILA